MKKIFLLIFGLLLVLGIVVSGCGIDYSKFETKEDCLNAKGVWEPAPVTIDPPEKIGTCNSPQE